LSAASFQQAISRLADQTARWVVSLLQFALPIALVVYVGLFTQMAHLMEVLMLIFVSIAFVSFSLFAARVLELADSS
jgi:uncharacterized membrane protein